jgi:hypothetical protein
LDIPKIRKLSFSRAKNDSRNDIYGFVYGCNSCATDFSDHSWADGFPKFRPGTVWAIFCAVIVFPVAMAVRLIATPIVNIFEPQDKPFNIPRS